MATLNCMQNTRMQYLVISFSGDIYNILQLESAVSFETLFLTILPVFDYCCHMITQSTLVRETGASSAPF